MKMEVSRFISVICCWTVCASVTIAATHYVDLASSTPTAPYISWATAATNIQDAVDTAVAGDTVVVTNGHYLLSSEIVSTNDITIQSVNGPAATIVDGQAAVRCFSLGNAACTVSGLTITNGYTLPGQGNGGGVYCTGSIPVLTNCVVVGNHADLGGGMIYGTAFRCIFRGNSAWVGGGMAQSIANDCWIEENTATLADGGMDGGMANNCVIVGNSSLSGGGIGSYYAATVTANNCIIAYNNAVKDGGGAYGGTVNNCIVWYNHAPVSPNLYSGTASYSCSPDVTNGVDGNITNAPLLVSTSHVATNSPCRGAGSSTYVFGTDIDGEAWQTPPSIGCDEYHGSVEGSLKPGIECATNTVVGYPLHMEGRIEGALSMQVWDFGDGTVETNAIDPVHAWASPDTYDVTLTAYNDTYPSGVTATQTIHVATSENTAVYVAVDGSDSNNGSSWATAKATIQAGVDAQEYTGGTVWVSNGTYAVNLQIMVDKDITIRSVNGPESTIVDGQGKVRCFSLFNAACVISGLTVTNGYISGDGAGIHCDGPRPVITNCTICGNSATFGSGIYNGTAIQCFIENNTAINWGGGMLAGKAIQCTFIHNTAYDGGGCYLGLATNCTITGNSAQYGGGIFNGAANKCTISSNSAASSGGGVCQGTVNNCTISGNSADSGGGMDNGTANNCWITGNFATNSGGGVYQGTVNNSVFNSNNANTGGGIYSGTANNCTISENTASGSGGGVYQGTANNSIVWYNQSPSGPNLYSATAHYSCSPGLTPGVNGNITNAPVLLTPSHVATNSPCRGAGSSAYTSGTDIDGEAWLNPPSMGCDEYRGSVTGSLHVSIESNATNVVFGTSLSFQGLVEGAPAFIVWNFDDGTYATNTLSASHTWSVPGTYAVTLTAYNDAYPSGVSATKAIHVATPEELAIYVAPDGDDANDGSSWATAKATIQNGVDAQGYEGGLVLVSNGTYAITSTITINKKVIVKSVNGKASTIVDGQGSVSCFGLGNTACVISGFTITNGYSAAGGGVNCSGSTPVITNCTISGNVASVFGGGIYFGTVNNCTISGNRVTHYGGGLYNSTANNCKISDNSAQQGGGLYQGTAKNCMVSSNSASSGGGVYHGIANNCAISGNNATSSGGGMSGGTANNCSISGNSASSGGGIASGTVSNCTISGNTASNSGGGMNGGSAKNCVIRENNAFYGGGMSGGTANNCAIISNNANYFGGGMYQGTANNCTINGNSSSESGGGMNESTANNCIINGNSAAQYGGGLLLGTANNCTISDNNALTAGGGMSGGTVNNCIVWYNQAPSGLNLYSATTRYSCSPDVTDGVNGNITNAPLMISTSHIAAYSPCRGAGSSAYASGTDIDGQAWLSPPSMGCDEYYGPATGPLQVAIESSGTNVVYGNSLSFHGLVAGDAATFIWSFADGTFATNTFDVSHTWSVPGAYIVTLTAYNDTYPSGVSASQTVHVATPEDLAVYVAPDGDDANDGSSWATAKATIQAGVNAQGYESSMVLVSNGTYAVANQITVNKKIIVKSLSGPGSTVVDGQGSVRCFNLGNTACTISGFTIMNGYANGNGGGVYCSGTSPVVTNCTISGSSAGSGGGMYGGTAKNCIVNGNSSSYGGGMRGVVAKNCTISGNGASVDGGGMYGGLANDCTISGNNATQYGGGLYQGTVNNCIVWYNQASSGQNLYSTTAHYSCSPDVTHGTSGNITNAPVLVSTSHVATNSPCRGAGSSAYVSGTDIDGEAWLNPPSMGCDEYHGTHKGALQVAINCSNTNVVVGSVLPISGVVEGNAIAVVWNFDDGTYETNNLYPAHAWRNPGTYTVTLTAYNDTYASGISATQTIHVITPEEVAVYVAPDGDDSNDGSSWATAKATIQAGVAAQGYPGGLVLVSNGTYAVSSAITISKKLIVRSVNGPAYTVVDGQGSVRCFNLGNVACTVSGLTITNGYTSGFAYGGGIACSGTKPVITNCIVIGNSAYYGGGIYNGTVNNCTISGNSGSTSGGGMLYGTANNCLISDNRSGHGGGMYGGSVNNCIISNNSATAAGDGGGLYSCTANNCTIIGNSAGSGGGMYGGAANNCSISDNRASTNGGGMNGGTANNCAFSGNSAQNGGGMYQGTANNCTISGNSATQYGGGLDLGSANNCIVWYNLAPSGTNLYLITARYSCSPDVTNGVDGNISSEPMLVSTSHVATNSPCRGAGDIVYTSGTDIDGEAWLNPPSMGCDEYHGTVTGDMRVSIQSGATSVVNGYPIAFQGFVDGTAGTVVWDFDDGMHETNTIYTSHTWTVPGTYTVTLTAYNNTCPSGISATQTIHVATIDTAITYVSVTGDDSNDGMSWATAKATIQAGVDAGYDGGGMVLVSNGTYSLTAQITVDKHITIRSVNGPASTVVDGQGSVRCFYLGNTACTLSGFTVTNGYTSGSGGGIYCSGIIPIVTNCTVSGNSANNGGGIYQGTANDCAISSNSATSWGGGMYQGTANNCTFLGNYATYGGGMYNSAANNCIVSGNSVNDGNGATISPNGGGGMARGIANNCIVSNNSAGLYGGGMNGCTANNCTVSGNSAGNSGGGMTGGAANNCTISSNTANFGGGLYSCTASNCMISGNSGEMLGGGIEGGTANNCTISDNTAPYGGGMYDGTANNCTISGNSVASWGGGVYYGTANGCVISGNSASHGGGLYHSTANNCTISGNSASSAGGGMSEGTANNCITWYNHAPSGANLYSITARYSCSPDVTNGVDGNITNMPILISTSHVATNSPCRGAGNSAYASGTDIDGEGWLNPPSMGCDEYHGLVTGNLNVAIECNAMNNILAGTPTLIQGFVEGAAKMLIWNFDDGTLVTNMLYPSAFNYTWRTPGAHKLTLTAYNDTYPSGVSATQTIHIVTLEDLAVYVAPDGNDSNDGSSWATAKATIQAGIDAQRYTGGLVLVSNGTYAVASAITINKKIIVQGLNGPASTIVDGQGSVRCFNLGNAACTLSGFTITHGYASDNGGGIYCSGTTPIITNCIISGNSAVTYGGGLYQGTANNCTIRGNSANTGGGMANGTANNCVISGNNGNYGGGMYLSTANNCTISGNTAVNNGAGMNHGTANNCIIYYNTAPSYPNLRLATASYSCSPDVTAGVSGNITNTPLFVDHANSDYHLLPASPCINVGSNAFAVGTTDFGGNPRIIGPAVDMGAYEYVYTNNGDADGDGMSNAWELKYFGNLVSGNPSDDPDHDGSDNLSEYIAGTDPLDAGSVFAITNDTTSPSFILQWGPCVTGRWYDVRWTSSLTNSFQSLQDNIEYPQNSYTDTAHSANSAAGFYTVDVRLK